MSAGLPRHHAFQGKMAAEQGYESARKKLTGERENIQKKTFTKWVNSFLKGVSNSRSVSEAHPRASRKDMHRVQRSRRASRWAARASVPVPMA